MPLPIRPGGCAPLGAQADAHGVNFAVYAPDAASLALRLYVAADAPAPAEHVALDPRRHRTGDYWHVYVEGLAPGGWYTWVADDRELLDPCAREVSTLLWDRRRALAGEGGALRARVVADDYDWEEDAPLALPPARAIVYELHVGGYTRHPSARSSRPGTFAALIDRIPWLVALGVTHVELMPVMAFDEQDVPPGTAARGLHNFWGYSPCAFFAVHPGHATAIGDARRELRDLVKALHRAGLGVILDVVFNHTAEGDATGPVINCKALGRSAWYHLDARGEHVNYSGCGNTVNCNHPVTSRILLDCAEYWARELHVDGLRFDMASVLTRGEDGVFRADAWLPGALASSPVLAQTWLIAEPWDAGGLYQVGSFPRARFAEWNGRYRDAVRRFVRGDGGMLGEIAERIAGSPDLYATKGRPTAHSINFVTCHDGFTLWDLVSYERKHNEGNGEGNRDGTDANWSSNCGVEGETTHPLILRLRTRQARNFMAILLLSRGVPMILAGDEMLRTQRGNNNAYCQDNALGWIDWSLAEANADMLRFLREAIALRKRHPALSADPADGAVPAIAWHGAGPAGPQWKDPESRVLAFTLTPCEPGEEALHAVLNMSERATHATLPSMRGLRWHVAIDTWRAAPADIVVPAEQAPHGDATVLVHAFSVVVLEGR